jgi:TetR/AcrR family transcriptional regulator, mexJK operon transcriptional repressor
MRRLGRPTRQGVAELEAQLVDIAAEEFLARGYGGASLSRIVQRARMSKTTLYSRYPSKEALFREVVRQLPMIARPSDALPQISSTVDLEKGLENFAYEMITAAFQARPLRVTRLVLSESPRFPELAQMASENTSRGIDRIANFIAGCAHQRDIETGDARSVAECFIHMLRGWYFDQIMTGRAVPDEERRLWARKVARTVARSASVVGH